MHRIVRDVRIALRGFRLAPAFATTAVLILGIGIGMAVAMMTVFDAVLIQGLPVAGEDRIVVPRVLDRSGVDVAVAPAELDQLRRESRTMQEIAGVDIIGAYAFPLLDGDRSIVLRQAKVTGNFFELLGTRAVLGRLLNSDDDIRGAAPVAVISYVAWRGQFSGDSAVIGRPLTEPIFQTNYTIVGVAPPGIDYPAGADYWITGASLGGIVATLVARLAPDATAEAARSELFALVQRTHADRVAPERLARADVRTFTDAVVGNVRPVLQVLTAAVALLLLIACVNVGNLLLLRGTARAQELAVRRALGGSSRDIVRQLLTENVLLAGAGGMLGLVCAGVLLRVILAFAPAELPRADVIRLAGLPLGMGVGITALAVLLFGVAPALMAARSDLASPLRFDARSGRGTRHHRRVRESLVAFQVALALIMLAGAGLLARSLARLERLELGYTAESLSIFELAIPWAKYRATSRSALLEELFGRLRAVPGVTALTPVLLPPFVGPEVRRWTIAIEGQSKSESDANPTVAIEAGGAEYFRTLGVPILRGRAFTDSDRENTPPVAVVSEAVARHFWPGQDAVGKRIRFDIDTLEARTVIGVASDIHFRSLRETTPTVFLPWRQSHTQGYFAVRTTGSVNTILPAMRRTVEELDPQLTLWRGRSMDELLAGPLARPRLSTLLLSSFGLVALLLAAIGLYGAMAAVVRERTRELGVRMALGATPAQVRRDVLRQALLVTGAGTLVGAAGVLATSRLFTALLFEVGPTDPAALLGASATLLAAALIAAYLPARRATKIDPAQALRAE